MSEWSIANAKDMQWFDAGRFGFNIGMTLPGQPGALYHRESHQEGFLRPERGGALDRRG